MLPPRALQGADADRIPTRGAPTPDHDQDPDDVSAIPVMAAAHSCSAFVAAADRVGVERWLPFVGQSLIASFTVWPISGPASAEQEEIILADANLVDAPGKRSRNECNQVLRDCRTDVHSEMPGAGASPSRYRFG